MTKELIQVKDKMLDNLKKVIERGESLDELQQRASELKLISDDVVKKTKKLNQGWFGRCASRVTNC